MKTNNKKKKTNVDYLNQKLTAGMNQKDKEQFMNTQQDLLKEATKDGGFSIGFFDAMKIINKNK
jgi:hypothetical protein